MKIIVTFTFLDWLYIMKTLNQKEIIMKKTLFISLLVCIFASLFITSCGSSDPTYWESWNEIEGYMILDEGENVTTRHFEPYSPSITDTSHEATLYSHSYSRTPETSFTVQEWDTIDIEYKDKSTNRFTISNKPKELNGFIFYKDSENLYIINTLFNNENKGLKLKAHENKYTNADYRFLIDVYGIHDEIEILMDDRRKWD